MTGAPTTPPQKTFVQSKPVMHSGAKICIPKLKEANQSATSRTGPGHLKLKFKLTDKYCIVLNTDLRAEVETESKVSAAPTPTSTKPIIPNAPTPYMA